MPRNPECSDCVLHSQASHICLWGEGRGRRSSVMILGQSPGYEENRAGRPFIGPSGRLLSEALAEAGLEDYYITNTVKCFPGRLKVDKKHIKACAAYLDEEIEKYHPTHILALGNEAVQRLLGKGRIMEIAGKEQWSEKYNCWVVGAFHHAFILRQMGRIGAWKADLYRFARLVKGDLLDKPPVNVKLVGVYISLSDFRAEFVKNCKAQRPVAFDFETTYSPWWTHDWLAYTIAFSWDATSAYCLPLHHPESLMGDRAVSFLKEMQEYMAAPQVPKIGHNGAIFDANCWQRLTGYPIYVNYDTMIEAQLIDENRPKGLKWLGRAVLGWPDWDIDAKQYHPLNMLSFYNGCDTAATFALHEKQFESMDADLKRYYTTLEMPKARAVQTMMHNGIYVDSERLDNAIQITSAAMAEAASRIPVKNPNSPAQIAEWLYGREGLPVPHYTQEEGGKPSTDQEAINTLADRFPQARVVRDYRTYAKRLGTWLTPAKEDLGLSIDQRRHFDYKLANVETGRLSSPYHTTPREPLIRSIYSAPRGWTLISADYSQLEARLVAWTACGRPNSWDSDLVTGMLKAFLDGREIYLELAAAALRKPQEGVTRQGPKSERQIMGKVPTLAMLYRISPEGLREYAWKVAEIRYSEAEARHLWQLFRQLWPEIPRWHEREERLLRARGIARSVLGRVRHLPEATMGRSQSAHEAINSGINSPIQGLASDINCTAQIILQKKLNPQAALLVGSHHDSLQAQVADHYRDEARQLIVATMEAAPRALLSLGLDLPLGLLKVEVSEGPWGDK